MFEVAHLQGSRSEQPLFRNLTFKLNAGEWIWVKGENGRGKTTLLKILAGLILPDKGYLSWSGKKLKRFEPHFLHLLLYLGHHPALNPTLTVSENILWSCLLQTNLLTHKDQKHKDQKKDLELLINKALKDLNVHELADIPCEQLSFGQKQRVSLLRLAINQEAILWILDEPGTGLDEKAKEWIVQQINQHLQKGGMAVIASHEPFQNLKEASNVILLNDNINENKINRKSDENK